MNEKSMHMKIIEDKIKCVVWDLDNTLWDGVLLENDEIKVKEEIINVIMTFDKRGILNSIASRNDVSVVKEKMLSLGLWEYFVYPEIGWNNKSESLTKIAENLNIGIDSFAFVDDQPFEREEVKFSLSSVRVYSPAEILERMNEDIFQPKFITNETALRRKYYLTDIQRNKTSELFKGNNIEFLRSLDLEFTIKYVREMDLQRAEELTVRTNQLNTTGITYSYDELFNFMNSNNHSLYICSLKDKFGEYGTVGLALIEKSKEIWKIKLMLVSCRVISRNAGNAFINVIGNLSRKKNKGLQAEFLQNDKNRQMYIAYKFNGYKEVYSEKNFTLFELEKNYTPQVPDYIKINYALEDFAYDRAS